MSSITADAPSSPQIPPEPPLPLPKRGHPLIAWFVILIAVVVAAGYEQFATHWSERVAAKLKTQNERGYLSDLQLQGREIVGLVRVFGQAPDLVDPQIQEGLKHGPYEERLRYVTLVGEMHGPKAALEKLSAMRANDWKQRAPTEAETELTALLEKLYRIQTSSNDKVNAYVTIVLQTQPLVAASGTSYFLTVPQPRQTLAVATGGSLMETAVKEAHAANEPEETGLSLSDAERSELRKKLDWYGELALAPADGPDPAARAAVLAAARRTTLTLFFVAATVFTMGSVGFFLLLLGVGLLLLRMVHFRFRSGSRDGGIYAETFALWMVVYMALEVAAMFIPAGSWHMLLAGGFGLTSLLTLGWPVLRGISWRRVRQDLGWWTPGSASPEMGFATSARLTTAGCDLPRQHSPHAQQHTVVGAACNASAPVATLGFKKIGWRSMATEMGWGLGGYLAAMPLVFLGGLVSAGMLSLYLRFAGNDPFSIPPQSTHPVKEMLARGSWWECVQIFLVAAVCAPIIEETMFRGVLYRHLREIGDSWPRFVSVLFSMVVASFVFAVIHPQGFLGVPVLMALAAGFALTRELRGSLLGSITAHGINNALVTLLVISMS